MDAEELEHRLLSILKENPKSSLGEIADQAGVARPTARKYIEKLEEEGAIVGYTVEIDPKKVSHQSIAMVGIDIESDQYVEAITELRNLDSLTALYTATGDHMLMAELEATGSTELNEIVSNQILSISGVTTACPAVLQERLE
ncbi:winged helix-turn-helix transcriptional regulator [Halovenus salina]|uniref:winged helix-turn-helix transcriptional regulator n=1 Tax=Halovenus salina TaxID=1510225 RepID=UPI002260CB16|nr:winged helix-turn-helix transcriptional regulator [Halovenus salina]